MSFLLRLIGVLAMIGTVGAAADGGGHLVKGVFDLVKRTVTLYELAGLRDRLVDEHGATGLLPRPGDREALAGFIREAVRARSGGRDPSVDLWGQPYGFERGDTAEAYVLFSRGPDGEDGECGDPGAGTTDPDGLGGGADDICVWLDLPRSQAPFRPIR